MINHNLSENIPKLKLILSNRLKLILLNRSKSILSNKLNVNNLKNVLYKQYLNSLLLTFIYKTLQKRCPNDNIKTLYLKWINHIKSMYTLHCYNPPNSDNEIVKYLKNKFFEIYFYTDKQLSQIISLQFAQIITKYIDRDKYFDFIVLFDQYFVLSYYKQNCITSNNQLKDFKQKITELNELNKKLESDLNKPTGKVLELTLITDKKYIPDTTKYSKEISLLNINCSKENSPKGHGLKILLSNKLEITITDPGCNYQKCDMLYYENLLFQVIKISCKEDKKQRTGSVLFCTEVDPSNFSISTYILTYLKYSQVNCIKSIAMCHSV